MLAACEFLNCYLADCFNSVLLSFCSNVYVLVLAVHMVLGVSCAAYYSHESIRLRTHGIVVLTPFLRNTANCYKYCILYFMTGV
jgi:hypothetical protein